MDESNLWRRVRTAAGIPETFTLHDLRHFFASRLAANFDVVTVQSAFGHSDASITLRVYSHLWPRAESAREQRARG